MNFRTIMPYLELLVKDGLMEFMDGSLALYKTTPKGIEALGHIRALESLIPGLSFED